VSIYSNALLEVDNVMVLFNSCTIARFSTSIKVDRVWNVVTLGKVANEINTCLDLVLALAFTTWLATVRILTLG
jgi:hypothetical protein